MEMKVEILGSGGAITTPAPGCGCRVCSKARKFGLPYSRTGPGIFIHGPDILIDTSEEIKQQLNRSNIDHIEAGFYSHWHPDHVAGLRVWESVNNDFRNYPPEHDQSSIYLPQGVASDFKMKLGYWEHFIFMEEQRFVRLNQMKDGDSAMIRGTSIFPFQLQAKNVYAFLIEHNQKRVLIVPDEIHHWKPPAFAMNLNLAILPTGVFEFNPLTGERKISKAHPVLNSEATFRETIEIAKTLQSEKFIFSHIEEPDQMDFDDLKQLEKQFIGADLNIEFAYDTMSIPI